MTELTREDVIELDSQAAKELKSIDRVAGGNTAGFIGERLEWLTKIRAVCTLALEALNQREQGGWSDTNEHGHSKQSHRVAQDIVDYFGQDGMPDRVEIYRSVYGGLSVVIGNERGGYRISGGKVGGGSLAQNDALEPSGLLCAMFSNAQLKQIARALPTPPAKETE